MFHCLVMGVFFFKQKTAYEMRTSDWSSDVCSSDLLELSPDPSRDVILIAFRLTGKDVKLYALLAPHLGGSGLHNNARADPELLAWTDGNALHLAADCGFSRTSAGYVGHSDGWQDRSEEHTSELQSLMRISYAV